MKLHAILAAFALLIFSASLTLAAPAATQFQLNDAYDITATVASSGTTSGAVDLAGTDLVGIFIPSTFDGTTITFTVSTAIDGTYVAVEDGLGSAYTITTTASRYVPISNVASLVGARYLKIVTGSTQTSTSTVFTLALRPI